MRDIEPGSVILVTGTSRGTGPFVRANPASFAGLRVGSFQRPCRAALPSLTRQGGTVVAVAADSSRFAAPRQSALGGAYAAIMSFVFNLTVGTPDIARPVQPRS